MSRVDPNDPRPPYHQIADDVRRQVAAGALNEGDKLPPIRELATAYGVAPMTVHQAIRVLRDEGVLTSYQGRGVFVESTARGRTEIRHAGQFEHETARHLADIDTRLDTIQERLGDRPENPTELVELRRDIADLRAHLIDLYARTGHKYPHRADPDQARPTSTTRRRASGA
jgi:DNA-binding GntR family transcriptional regulator